MCQPANTRRAAHKRVHACVWLLLLQDPPHGWRRGDEGGQWMQKGWTSVPPPRGSVLGAAHALAVDVKEVTGDPHCIYIGSVAAQCEMQRHAGGHPGGLSIE